ncbi:MAG: hypothetical protein Q7K42_05950 [Candidatus Diapherotrites archaeon]|nr:hypothetical protein [Candidatus Diapherotrites archaeon]
MQKKFPKARCFGFGDLYFPEWEEQRNTTFIHAPGEDFSRYFKNGSIDFMYSYCGLEHLNLGEKVQEYYCMLANKLALEGELFNHGLYSIIWRVFGWEAQHKIYQASLKAQKKPYKVDFTWELGKKKFKITYQSRNSILIIKRIE